MRQTPYANNRTALTDDKAAWAYRKWCSDYTMEEIGAVLHVGKSTLSNEFAARGWKKQKQPLVYGD